MVLPVIVLINYEDDKVVDALLSIVGDGKEEHGNILP